MRPLRGGFIVLVLLCGIAGPAYGQQPTPRGPSPIDGPVAGIPSPSGLNLSIARDGTGGLVYLKQGHVFLSVLQGGVFQAPAAVDAGLAGPSSQPVVAAGRGGLLQVAFVNGGVLYVAGRASAAAPFSAPAGVAAGAIDPAISMSDFGKAYLAFAVAAGAGYDIRAAYYFAGRWAPEAPALNVTPADSAGAPQVATAGDGVGIVVWAEAGHVFSRRVWGTTASVVAERADAPPGGCTESSADSPAVGTEGDSSYAQVAFHEVTVCGGHQVSRVFANRLHASVYDGLESVDGLNNTSIDGAVDPEIAMGEYGHGWVTSARRSAGDVLATAFGDTAVSLGTTQVNLSPNAISPSPEPATAGLYSNFIAWQQSPGSAGAPEIRIRYATDGSTLGPELVVSSPAQGPTEAGAGIAAAGDVNGDAAVAWLQGTPGATWVMTSQLYQPPGQISVSRSVRYENMPYPVLQWATPRALWGPMAYGVILDGTPVVQTSATSVRLPSVVANGPHRFVVGGVNPVGQATPYAGGTVFVDTVPPTGRMTLYGRPAPKTSLHVYVSYADRPAAGARPSTASGVASVVVRWGDGTVASLQPGTHRCFHAYRRTGRYLLSLQVRDRAGNFARQVIRVVVKDKPKRKHRAKHARAARRRSHR